MIDTRLALENLLGAHDKLSKASGDARNQAIAAVEVAEDAAREALEADDGLALRMETERADGNARSCRGFMAALKTIRDAAEEAIGMPWHVGGMPESVLAEKPPMTDNAKELLALADELAGLRFSSEVAINEDAADKLDQISGHLRRLARQQASVEEGGR